MCSVYINIIKKYSNNELCIYIITVNYFYVANDMLSVFMVETSTWTKETKPDLITWVVQTLKPYCAILHQHTMDSSLMCNRYYSAQVAGQERRQCILRKLLQSEGVLM